MEHGSFKWWQRGVVYQIYPRSFMDSNGDGVGDLPGITRKLDYVRWLGVDAIWLSPISPSPMADFGYDISDYTGVHPLFGTLADFDELLREAHARGLRVILDFVPNHTSSEHPWFLESRSSRESPKRDWYIWRDPAPGGAPPNNWQSNFGGSAWEYDERTGQYYYHAFLKEQPDLNWRDPEVQDAMLDVLRFWLDRGVDGFRVDVIWHLIKDELFRDNPPNPTWTPDQRPYDEFLPVYTADRPEVHQVISRMRRLFDEYEDRVLIGEIYLPVEKLVTYYGENDSETHLPFNFQLILAPWDARHIQQIIDDYEAALPEGGWPNWVLGNHDQHRIASRVGPEQARVAAIMLLTLRGTPTLYYGAEIGMHDVDVPPERVQDPYEKNVPGRGLGRDPERTPMQWSAAENAGFTTGTPWLPISPDYQTVNVEREREDPASMLALYRGLIELRRGSRALEVGSYTSVAARGDVLAYIRSNGDESFLVALNLGSEPQELGHASERGGRIVIATHREREGEVVGPNIPLAPNEGVVVRLEQL
ncbi:MAG TPA: alpha-amylase family glycosyl hydrolase [Longimicrobiaceae bacterium]|nr:alpha-amylase family glycosyl hydrolase [Longimicrobiaceae bacterium]